MCDDEHHDHDHGHDHGHAQPQPLPPQGGTIHVADAKKAPPFYLNLAGYLRDTGKSGIKMRQGVFNGSRVDYFKGKGAVNALLKDTYKQKVKGGEPVNTREDAIKVLNNLGRHGFILRVNRGDAIGGKGGPRILQANPQQELKEDSYYMWIWEGSQLKLYLGAVGLVITVLAAVLFPLWPESLRLGVWYLSVAVLGLLGVFFGIAVVRLIFYLITIVFLPRGIWMFPNLFEDVGVIESFIPFWAWDEPKKSKKAKPSVTQEATSAAAAAAGVAADPAPVAAAATTEKE